MSSRLALLHARCQQRYTLLPTVRKSRVAPLALLSRGILWAGSVSLPRADRTLPSPVSAASSEQRAASSEQRTRKMSAVAASGAAMAAGA